MKEYNRRRGNEYSRFHGYTYDGIWAVALAIQYVSEKKEHFLQNFQYHAEEWESIFLEALANTSFEGVTGPVRFYNNERKASFQLNQFQNGQEVKVGEYSSMKEQLDMKTGEPMKWVRLNLTQKIPFNCLISGWKVTAKRSNPEDNRACPSQHHNLCHSCQLLSPRHCAGNQLLNCQH